LPGVYRKKGDYFVIPEGKPRILVVDDDPSLQKLVGVLLGRAGMESIGALNATEAAKILRTGPLPDLVILDLMLPDISGIDFLRQMRQKVTFDHLPVLILSALADPDQIREGLSAGADRYLTKPYLANNLIATVNDLLRSGRKTE
jgi:two-component system, OmpR family, phosphate regulon response regulator PhoB